MHQQARRFIAACVCSAVVTSGLLLAEPVAVRYTEGIVHGFLALRTLDGVLVANGDLMQVAQGDRVTSRLVFRFKDGSVRDETSVFSQTRSSPQSTIRAETSFATGTSFFTRPRRAKT